jgi:hypothetical protein
MPIRAEKDLPSSLAMNKPQDSYYYEVNGDHVIEEPGYQEDQYPGDEGYQGLK